ncbi:MAG: LLM class flavin-dependent oxidoreductase [Chloroflexota bacterium]|nr:LLM class flavin-dependent oxidoreductase [Dehalococcoidia bacterium]MDW8252609.1 LLM class flavin-dependent oxidoreductase [Chloroflexota bacterium]
MSNRSFGCRVETGLARYDDAAAQARAAEAAGFDSIWIRDHVAIPETTGDPNCLEVFTTLAGLARDTQRVKLGTLVVCTPWRNPALIAKMGATIDVMSHGRLILGLGAGSPNAKREFTRYGWELAPQADRIRALGEAIQIIRKMWTEPAPTFEGRYHRIHEAVCEPFPIQRPHPPILIGASGEQLALKNVARHADIWESSANVEDFRRKSAILDRYCEEIGRDPATIRRAVHQMIIVDEPGKAEERLQRIIASRPEQRSLLQRANLGSPEQVAERIRPYFEAGASLFIAFFWDISHAAQMESIERFGREVIPLLR